MSESLSLASLAAQRERFRPAPYADTQELPLLEKQALVDEILRGMPIKALEYYEEDGMYMVTQGWPQVQAILDFMDNKFMTWTQAEMQQWQRKHSR